MLPIYRHRWFYRIVRANTSQIPIDVATKWKKGLSFVYVVAAFGLFVAGREAYTQDKAEKKRKYGEVDETSYWLQKMGHEEMRIVKMTGFDLSTLTEEEYNVNKLREEEAGKNKQSAGSSTNCGVRGCDQAAIN